MQAAGEPDELPPERPETAWRRYEASPGATSTAPSLGFASLENLLYVYTYGPEVMIGRAPISTVALVGLGLAWTLGRFGWARRNSPFRYLRNYPRVERPNCHRLITIISRRCSHYRTVPGAVSGPIHCSNCGNRNRSDAKFCTACGDRFEVSRR